MWCMTINACSPAILVNLTDKVVNLSLLSGFFVTANSRFNKNVSALRFGNAVYISHFYIYALFQSSLKTNE